MEVIGYLHAPAALTLAPIKKDARRCSIWIPVIKYIIYRAVLRRVHIVVKASVSYVMSVRLSLRMYPCGSHWKDFREI